MERSRSMGALMSVQRALRKPVYAMTHDPAMSSSHALVPSARLRSCPKDACSVPIGTSRPLGLFLVGFCRSTWPTFLLHQQFAGFLWEYLVRRPNRTFTLVISGCCRFQYRLRPN